MKTYTFEGNSLEEALSAVKNHLGPEAVILKTNNYSGIQGALKKNKFEVIARKAESLIEDKNEHFNFEEYETRFKDLEKLVNELSLEIKESKEKKSSIYKIRKILKSFDLSEDLISHVLKKASFELNSDELKNEEVIYELVLREISRSILVSHSCFTKLENKFKSVITILCSPRSSGQSSMTKKLASLSESAEIICFRSCDEQNFSNSMLELDVHNVHTLHDLIAKLNRLTHKNRHVFIDLNTNNYPEDHTKKIIHSIKKNFKRVEVLLSLSAIHSELYNKRISQIYKDIADGAVVSHLDLSLNLSALVNVQFFNKLPYKFFGTGPVIPKDLEEASREKIISHILSL